MYSRDLGRIGRHGDIRTHAKPESRTASMLGTSSVNRGVKSRVPDSSHFLPDHDVFSLLKL
jgi:hypothetical protein